MIRGLAVHSCYACDYLGPAAIVDVNVICPDCGTPSLRGTWVNYDCKDCGFTGCAYTPPEAGRIPCKDCGILN